MHVGGYSMTLEQKYAEYCQNDGRRYTHLPFIIWLKQVERRKDGKIYKGADTCKGPGEGRA